MYIKIALIISVILQFIAAAFAITLIRKTRYNVSWILITIGFLLMAARRFFELIEIFQSGEEINEGLVINWMAVFISLLMFVGVIYIKQIFNIQERIDLIRKQNESKVFSAIIKTEEKSRQEFARDLHDGLGPILSSVKMSVSAIDKSKIDQNNREMIEHTEKNIDAAITAIKEISNNLSPHILKNYGLQRAVENFTDRFSTSDKPEIFISSNIQEKRFDYDTEITLYRIICELVANSFKHASAGRIDINLFYKMHKLELIYSDDGIGMDTESLETEITGTGLSNIFSRVKSLNGSIEVISSPNEGFNIKIVIAA
jgi:signal transduction histidine kinase